MYLDLSDFKLIESKPIPKFLGSMKQLKYLNISSVGFHGIIPYYFGNLTYLEVLDLHNDGSYLEVLDSPGGESSLLHYHVPIVLRDPHCISSLMALKHLDMSGYISEKHMI